jgi:hypothetical protein
MSGLTFILSGLRPSSPAHAGSEHARPQRLPYLLDDLQVGGMTEWLLTRKLINPARANAFGLGPSTAALS